MQTRLPVLDRERITRPVTATRHPNTKVGKDDWTRATLEVIAVDAVVCVKAESLAHRLETTKRIF